MAARMLHEEQQRLVVEAEAGEYADDVADNEDTVSKLGGCRAALRGATLLAASTFIAPAYAIAMVVMGTKHLDDCKIEPMIPVWLIVHGVIILVRLIMELLNKMASSSTPSNGPSSSRGYSCLSVIVEIFDFAWFIAGSVWVFRAWAKGPDYAQYWLDTGCEKSLFLFAFWTLIIIYIMVGVVGIGSIARERAAASH